MKFSATQIADFIFEHYDRANLWHEKALHNWISWNIENGFCLMVGEENKLMGLALVRPVMQPEKCVQSLEWDPEGDTYFCDLVIATKPKRKVLQALAFALLKRFGQKDKIAFQKHGVGPVYVVDAHEHRKRLLRTLSFRQHSSKCLECQNNGLR